MKPRSEIAIATSAIEIRSPAVSSMSSSRAGGSGLTSPARSSSSSVLSPIADTATTTSWPCFLAWTMRWATRLIAVGVGQGGAAVLLHDNAHGQILTARGSGTTLARDAARRRPRFYWGRLGRTLQHLIRRGDLVELTGELHVEPVVGDHGQQRVEHRAGEVAPGGHVGELPPPQRLGGVAEPEVAQAVLEVAGDAGQVVGELAVDLLGVVGVEDEAVGVDVAEHLRQAQAQAVEVGVGPDIGLVVVLGREVDLGAEAGAGEEDLADLEQEQRDAPPGVALGCDRAQRDQEALDLVGDLGRELVARCRRREPCSPARIWSAVVCSVIRPSASLRKPARASPRRRTPGRHRRGARSPGG